MTRTFALIALVPMLSIGAAAANDIDAIIRQGDADGDGRLSAAEATATAKVEFGKIDRDKNGVLTLEEISRHIVAAAPPGTRAPAEAVAAVARATLDTWDVNKDGRVTPQEFEASSVRLLMLADANGDQYVTREELLRFRSTPP